MVTLDVVGIPADYSKRLCAAVSRAVPEIAADRVIISAIHTHSAPGLFVVRNWWKAEPDAITVDEYRDFTETKVVEAVKAAWAARRPAGVAGGLGFARVGHCRRAVYLDGSAEMYGRTDRHDFAGMEGGEDSGVELMFLLDEKKVPFGAFVNVACPSQVMESTYKISSDFMGALREKLKKEFGPDFKTICQIGSAGCQAPRDLSRNYKGEPDFWREDGVEVIAERLLSAVRDTCKKTAGYIDYNPEFRHISRELSLPKRRASYLDWLTAKQEIAELEAERDSVSAYKDFCDTVHRNEKIPGRPGPYDDKGMRFVEIRNREAVVKRFGEQDKEPNMMMELHVVRLGSAVFASNPFELFLEFGQRMKARSKAGQTFVIQLANGCDGYLPSAYAESLGGYGALIINGKIGSDGGARLTDETVKEIDSLFQ
jgi:hypothetical protein